MMGISNLYFKVIYADLLLEKEAYTHVRSRMADPESFKIPAHLQVVQEPCKQLSSEYVCSQLPQLANKNLTIAHKTSDYQ